MGQIGAAPWSFKSETGWGGMTTTSKSNPGQFDLLENCYVSVDGSEIRSMPGYVCVFDPVTDARLYSDTNPATGPQGYESIHQDARRPVSQSAASTYLQQTDATTASDRMLIWNRPSTIHGVEQVHGRWIFFGESTDRFEPIYNAARTEFVYVTSYVDRGLIEIDLTLSSAPSTSTSLFNTISGTSGANKLYLEGLSGEFASLLNGKAHTVTNVVGSVVTISTNPNLAIAAVTGQTGIAARVSPKWAGASVNDISNDQESLTIWTATQRGNVQSDVIERVYPAHVANRQRDFGDASGNIFEGLTTGSDAFLSRRRQVSLPYRLVPHLAGNRLMMVAPGYGCVFQAPAIVPVDFSETSSSAGVQWIANDINDRPRCSGLPKAVQFEDLDKTTLGAHVVSAASSALAFGGAAVDYAFGGSSYPERTGTYKFCFAYKDEATGETGLMSEPITLATDNTVASLGFYLYPYYPGYLMHESLALSINVYRTLKDGDTFYYDRTIKMNSWPASGGVPAESSKYGLTPSIVSNEYHHHGWYAAIYQSDDSLKENDGYVPSAVEQMPMGAKAARTIRGWTIYGGSLGDSGPNGEMQKGSLTLEYDNSGGVASTHFYNNEVTTKWTTNATASFESMEEGFGCGSKAIPASYMGQQVFSRTLFPYPRQIVRLNKLLNTRTGNTTVRRADVRYSILDTPVRTNEPLAADAFRNEEAFLLMPRGKLQISEPDNPGVVPATNTSTVANESDEDIEGIGDAGGQGVICTRSKTYMLGFGGSPVGVNPDVASDQFGCIAPNSMVSFDGGCAWISDRGPVAMMGGVVSWIGQDLERLFYGESARYLRDRRGMMRHAWGHHDAERGLLYFGVFADRAVDTDQEVTVRYRGGNYTWTDTDNQTDCDKIRSRFPCDEVLIYSYRTGVWSVWRPPTCLGIMWMARGLDVDGNNRTHFLGNDKRLYAMDDAFGQFDRESNKTAIAQTGATTTITGLTTGIKMRASQSVIFYTGGGTTAMRLIGKRTIDSTTATTVTLDSSITLPAGGCTMLVGPHESKIRTTFVNWKRAERSQAGQLGLRYSLWSRHSAGLVDEEQGMFASATGKSSTRIDQVHTVKTGSYTTDGAYTYQPLSETPTSEHVFEKTFELGEVGGMNHQFEIELIGGAQIRIADLYTAVK